MTLFQETEADPRASAARFADVLAWYGAIGDATAGNPDGFAVRKAQAGVSIARGMDLAPEDVDSIYFAALLHSIGALENDAFRKGEGLPERLARMEYWDVPAQGARLSAQISGLPAATPDYIRWQAERWDGTGAPDQLLWTTIPRGAQVLALADLYGRSESPDDVLARVNQESGRAFSPEIARAFMRWFHLGGGEPEPSSPPTRAFETNRSDIDNLVAIIADRIDAHNAVRGRWRRVADFADLIARGLSLDAAMRPALMLACAVYGVGEISARDTEDALYDPLARLGIEERARNAQRAAALAERQPALQHAAPIVRTRGEWYDGSGRPRGLAHDAIAMPARILSVAIAYESLDSTRRATPSAHAIPLDRITEAAGTQLDPEVVRALTHTVGRMS